VKEMHAKPLVVIFARAPRYGAVKTRLARDIGSGEALRFHRRTVERLVRAMARDARFETVLAVTSDSAVRAREFASLPVRVVRQGGGDLGRRMIRALRSAGARPSIVIGSDIPALSAAHVAISLRALGSAQIVFGPARDGGYWLIGARHPERLRSNALDGVRWSGPQALADSLARLRPAAVLDVVLDDVDDGAAYRALKST
jgi:uncharacterized protein